jgi:putative ABC transport system permease protein
VALDGVPVENRGLRVFGRRFLRTRSVTELGEKPPETDLLAGNWWPKSPSEPQVCVAEDAAKILGVRPGSVLDWDVWKRGVRTRVSCIHRTESLRLSARFEFLFSPGPLQGMPAVYYGGLRVRPPDVPSLQRVLYQQFPTVTVVNVADVMAIVEDVVQRIAQVIRFISGFTMLAGAVMVASSIAGTRFRRMREVVILKTLGATRRRIAWVFSVEFLALGTVAGVMGVILASAFAALVLKQLLEVPFRFDAIATAVGIVSSAMLAVAAGWLASYSVLGRKPLEILREE